MTTTSSTSPRRILHTTATAPQREFWGAQHKFRLYVGGVGAGKTRAGAVEVLRMPAGTAGMVVAPTYPMLRDATLETFLDLARRARVLKSFNKGDYKAVLSGDRTVVFRSADRPDRLRGPNLSWFWLDEAAMMPEAAWLVMLGRIRVRPAVAWVTTTPRGKNWLYKRFTEGGPDYRIVRASSRTNTFLPPDFVPSLLSAYDESFAAQEVEGEFLDDSFGQLVPDWWVDRLPQLVRPNLPGGPRWIVCDLGEGGGRDSTVVLTGDDLGILDGLESPWVGPAQAATLIRNQQSLYNVRSDRIVYDAGGGRGLDISPYLEQVGILDAIPYKGAGSGGEKFLNRRSKMAWKLRQRLDPEKPLPPPPLVYEGKRSVFEPEPVLSATLQPPFTLPPGDRPWWPLLKEELKALRYYHKGKQIALEAKEDLQQTLRRSPNVVDALLMRFILGESD